MKATIAIMMIFGAVAAAEAQVVPEGTSPYKVAVTGTITYSARYSEMAELYSGNSGQMAGLSGDFGYSTTSERKPTSITFGAGDGWSLSGTGYDSGLYESLSLAQGFVGQHSSLQLGDSVGYRKGAPITGFTGTPGSGGSISGSNSSPPAEEPVLTLNTSIVNESVTATYGYRLSGFTSVSAGGSGGWLLFPGGGGVDTDSYSANFGLTRRLNARNSLVGSYAFAQYSYGGAAISVRANTGALGWQRIWTRHVTTSVSAGPQWTSSSESSLAPSVTGVSASATVSDATKLGTANLSYAHGVTAGGGYLYGGELDNVTGSFGHQFGRQAGSVTSVEFAGGYSRTSSLSAIPVVIGSTGGTATLGFTGNINAESGSAQVTRGLGRWVSVYANYTATQQAQTSTLQLMGMQSAPMLVGGLWQVIGFGIGYTPRPIHLRQ